MKDTLANNSVSVEQFQTTLIISEILITGIVLYGFYLIFNKFNKKNKEFRSGDNSEQKKDV
jgi:hypothetical protein